MSRALSIVFLVVLLDACSVFSHQMSWSMPGADEGQARSDLDACEQEAGAQTKVDRQIDQDIAATGGTGTLSEPILDSNMTGYQTRARYAEIIDSCMLGLGYTRVE